MGDDDILDVVDEEESGPTQSQFDCLTNCYFDTTQLSQVVHSDPGNLSEIQIGHFTIEDLENINVNVLMASMVWGRLQLNGSVI